MDELFTKNRHLNLAIQACNIAFPCFSATFIAVQNPSEKKQDRSGLKIGLDFDEAMRRVATIPPPPTSKSAKRSAPKKRKAKP